MSPAARKVSAQVLLVATCLLLIAATLAAYATRALFDSDRFAERRRGRAAGPAVRQAVGDRVTDELVLPREADLLTARPLIAAAVARRGRRRRVRGAVPPRRARRARRGVPARPGHRHADAGRRRDRRGGRHPPARPAARRAVGGRTSGWSCSAATSARRPATSRGWRGTCGVLALVLAALALARGARRRGGQPGPPRRRGARSGSPRSSRASSSWPWSCSPGPSWWTVRATTRAVTAAVWDAFLGDLRTAGWLVAAVGCGARRGRGGDHPARRDRAAAARRLALAPRRAAATWLRVARGGRPRRRGRLVVARPEAALRFGATARRHLRALQGRGGDPPADRRAPPGSARPRVRSRRRFAAVAVAVAATPDRARRWAPGSSPPAAPTRPHRRRSRAATAAPACATGRSTRSRSPPRTTPCRSRCPGWFAALQERPIAGQLEDGIRGLLFDTHYADRLANGRTRTYFASPEEFRERDRAGRRQRPRACWRPSACAGGSASAAGASAACTSATRSASSASTPLGDVLDDIHAFLVTHPAEVVVVINQDYVTPAGLRRRDRRRRARTATRSSRRAGATGRRCAS